MPYQEMWSDILNKPKTGAAFRKDWAMLMNVPVEYDDHVEFRATHPDLLPKEDKRLETLEVPEPQDSSRSVLSDIGNHVKLPKTGGVKSGNRVSWSSVVRGKEKGNVAITG